MTTVRESVQRLERSVKDGRIVDAALREKAQHVVWDEDVVPVVSMRPPVDAGVLAALAGEVESAFGVPLPADLCDLLLLHDGIAVEGVVENELAHRGECSDFDEQSVGNVIMSASMLREELAAMRDFVANGLAPAGVMPFHAPYADEPLIRTALVMDRSLPNAGCVIDLNIKDRPSHRAPEDVTHYPVIARTFTEWFGAWLSCGFDRVDVTSSPADEVGAAVKDSATTEPIVVGDVILVDGAGYHWVTSVRAQHGTREIGFETFATPNKEPTRTNPRRALEPYCRKVSDSVRAEVLRLIPADILAILPSERGK